MAAYQPWRNLLDFQLSDEQLQLKKMVRDFAAREIAPNVMKWDEQIGRAHV